MMPYDDIVIGGGGGPPMEEGGPPTSVLTEVRGLSEKTIRQSGGLPWEAQVVATAVVAYVDWGWSRLGLRRLVANRRAWEAHLKRESYRRWLNELCRVRGRWAVPVAESVARARLLGLADVADLGPFERALFDHVYVFGFSVAETAAAFDLDHGDLVRRLRSAWARIHREYANLFKPY